MVTCRATVLGAALVCAHGHALSRARPAVIVGGGGGDDWRTRDIILPPDLGERFKAEVLPQATLIAAAGQRHNLGDAGWEEEVFAPCIAKCDEWAAAPAEAVVAIKSERSATTA